MTYEPFLKRKDFFQQTVRGEFSEYGEKLTLQFLEKECRVFDETTDFRRPPGRLEPETAVKHNNCSKSLARWVVRPDGVEQQTEPALCLKQIGQIIRKAAPGGRWNVFGSRDGDCNPAALRIVLLDEFEMGQKVAIGRC